MYSTERSIEKYHNNIDTWFVALLPVCTYIHNVYTTKINYFPNVHKTIFQMNRY